MVPLAKGPAVAVRWFSRLNNRSTTIFLPYHAPRRISPPLREYNIHKGIVFEACDSITSRLSPHPRHVNASPVTGSIAVLAVLKWLPRHRRKGRVHVICSDQFLSVPMTLLIICQVFVHMLLQLVSSLRRTMAVRLFRIILCGDDHNP
jgi:hypothetical protein